MRVTKRTRSTARTSKSSNQLAESDLNFTRGSLELSFLVDRLNRGLVWPVCRPEENKNRERLTSQVREEITREIDSVLDAMNSPTGTLHPLKSLIEKINALELRGRWDVCQPVRYVEDVGKKSKLSHPLQRTIKIAGKRYVVENAFSYSSNTLGRWSYRLVQEMFYRPLISVFEAGEFNRLRRCRWEKCRKFFAAEDLRREFCSDDCRIQFNNATRLESGWFKENREKKRKQLLNRARRLRKQGKTLEQVANETRLSFRVLAKEGVR